MNIDTKSDCAETSSAISVEHSLNISFEDISYAVRTRFFSREKKCILDSISGSFNAGELTVIMGQSGAGKSSLMDILAGYTKPTTGKLLVNGQERNEKMFRRRSCYILQDDKVQEFLTIAESLAVAAELKLGSHISRQQKKNRIAEVIKALGLAKASNTRAGNLSGGQKKRLAIGLELINDPPVLFLDEPTSGLDSSISKQIIFLLHLLARQGRTVVISMHQPSAALLQLVDKLYAVVSGRCAYMGSVPLLFPYLKQMNLVCPEYHNPIDFLIDISTERTSELVQYSKNGKNTSWTSNVSAEEDDVKSKYLRLDSYDVVMLTNLPPPKEDPTSKILLALKSTYTAPAWIQFAVLTRRALLSIWRNPSFTLMITGLHGSMALFLSILFYNIGQDAAFVNDCYNYLYFSLMFLMFTAFSAVTITFPEQLPVVRREHFNRWYCTGAYYLSVLVSVLPTQTVCTLTYACITYWMTGQPPDTIRFVRFCWTLLIVSYVSLCIGLLNGSLFDVKNGVIFGPFMIMPFTIFSGFFLRYIDAPYIFRWIFHASFLKHGLVGLVLTIFGMDRANIPCYAEYCHYSHPRLLLHDKGVKDESYTISVIALISMLILAIIFSFVVLKIRLKCKW